jgi:hypothetical protein
MKKIITIALCLSAVLVLAQQKRVSSSKVDEGVMHYFIEYTDGVPVLFKNKEQLLNYNIDKYIKFVDGKKVSSYSINLFTSEKTVSALNRNVFVTVVFADYSVINARPVLESEGMFNGNVTIEIKNIERLATIPVKRVIVKYVSENEEELGSVVFKAPVVGAANLMKDAMLLKNIR